MAPGYGPRLWPLGLAMAPGYGPRLWPHRLWPQATLCAHIGSLSHAPQAPRGRGAYGVALQRERGMAKDSGSDVGVCLSRYVNSADLCTLHAHMSAVQV